MPIGPSSLQGVPARLPVPAMGYTAAPAMGEVSGCAFRCVMSKVDAVVHEVCRSGADDTPVRSATVLVP